MYLLLFADLSHSDTRLSVQLNGFELHIYNRSDLYDQLEKTFGLKPSLLIPVIFSNKLHTTFESINNLCLLL